MSKAFTREDDDGGTALPVRSSALVPTERFHLTREGARQLQAHPEAHVRAALELADILDPATPAERALLGVIVHARNANGDERAIRLVSHEEQLLLGEGCSPRSPLGRALLGAEGGDVREIVTPRGREELEVLELATDVVPAKKSAVKKPVAKKPAAKLAKTNAPAAKTAKSTAKKPGKAVASTRRTRAAS
jgi:transcription elongation GreA/GreB family factor